MPETNEQRNYIITAVVLIVILGLVSLWHKPGFRYQDTTDYSKSSEDILKSQAYLDYLKTLKVDPEASKRLFENIITQDDIKKEVNLALKTDQPIIPPKIQDKQLNISADKGQQAITDYLTNTVGPVVLFNKQTLDFHKGLFVGDTASAKALLPEQGNLISKLLKAKVPQEAVALHKALLSSLTAYKDLLQTAQNYSPDNAIQPWPQVYQDYASINEMSAIYTQEFNKLSQKYQLSSLPPLHYAEGEGSTGNPIFAKKASAFLGVGDVSITVGDVPRLIMDAVKEGLVSAFSQFFGAFIQKLVDKIESNYLVANFLYYSDALISGQYTQDYLDKYVADTLDREVIKKFIPQFNCGQQPQNLKPLFQAKARQYLGFDPKTVDPKASDYYQKMARVGEFLASPSGWELYYQDLAGQAQSEAEKAAQKELTSSGLKTPRDTMHLSIARSISGIVSAEHASLSAIMQLGISNATSFVSKFVSELTQTLVNKFVFAGVTGNGNQLGVLKEQATCMAVAQLQVVLPAADSTYQNPPAPPNQNDLIDAECAKLPRGCTGQTPGQ